MTTEGHFKNISNKKVLLCECKRHTARRVVNTPSVVLTGYPSHPDMAGGVPYLGYPQGTPGYPWQGTPWQGTPARVPPTRVPLPTRVPPRPEYPLPRLDLAGYPPTGCPMAFWEMLQSIMGYGYLAQVWTN